MSTTTNPISYFQYGIGNALKQHKLIVPTHQREYSWGVDHVTRLFLDFARAIEDQDDAYFLGTIVTIPTGLGQYQVIDGQQRLATTTLFLHAIAMYLKEIGHDQMSSAVLDFINSYASDRQTRITRLSLNKADNDLFQRILTGKEIPQQSRPLSNQRILDAYSEAQKYVRQLVKPHDEKTHDKVLNKWLDFLEYKALVMFLIVSNRSYAFRMFETLNDRGLKTTQSDMVKNYLFSQGDDPACEGHWDTMRGILQTIETDEEVTITFIRHSMVLMYGYLSEKEVLDKVEKNVRGEPQALSFVHDLEKLALEYAAISNPSHDKWSKYPDRTRAYLENIILFDLNSMRPLLMAISMKFTPNEAEKAFASLENWTVRIVIATTTRSGSVEKPLVQAAKDIYSGGVTTTKQLKEKLSTLIPNDFLFEEAFRTATSSQAPYARYYLRKLEDASRISKEPYYVLNTNKEEVTLEHVMPSKPDPDWKVIPEILKSFSRRLGNMCLLSKGDNNELKSVKFDDRKAVYKASPYDLTREIADAPTWNETTIKDRQDRLAKLALKAWPL